MKNPTWNVRSQVIMQSDQSHMVVGSYTSFKEKSTGA